MNTGRLRYLSYLVGNIWAICIFYNFGAPQLGVWKFCGFQSTLIPLVSGLKTAVELDQCREQTASLRDQCKQQTAGSPNHQLKRIKNIKIVIC